MSKEFIEERAEQFRKEYDELGLKPPKNSMKNLERELIIDYWRKVASEAYQRGEDDLVRKIQSGKCTVTAEGLVCLADVTPTPDLKTRLKGCCPQCFVPSYDALMPPDYMVNQAMPDGCKDEDCLCHNQKSVGEEAEYLGSPDAERMSDSQRLTSLIKLAQRVPEALAQRERAVVTEAVSIFECGCEHCHKRAELVINNFMRTALNNQHEV